MNCLGFNGHRFYLYKWTLKCPLIRHENCLKQLKHAWGTKIVKWGTILGNKTMFIENSLNMAKKFDGEVASKLIQPHSVRTFELRRLQKVS